MCDKLVYDLAQEVEGSPCVFVRKDWINILDNQNQSYVSNQSVLDTSQLSNSNKWMSYREAYFSIPLTITMASLTPVITAIGTAVTGVLRTGDALGGTAVSIAPNSFQPDLSAGSADLSIGLKNWYGNIIHSFTLDYNGSTIIQQTPFVNMWNSFKLMTSLSYQDVITQGATIGFYPDDAECFSFYDANILAPPSIDTGTVIASSVLNQPIPFYGCGTMNNSNLTRHDAPGRHFNNYKSEGGNIGFIERQKWIAFDPSAKTGYSTVAGNTQPQGATYGSLVQNNFNQSLWKSYINRKSQSIGTINTQTTPGVIQYAVTATVYLKHIHSFFNMIPLLKGVFMKMTMNLNNSACTVIVGRSRANGTGVNSVAGTAYGYNYGYVSCKEVNSALGGSNMLMVASNEGENGGETLNRAISFTVTNDSVVPWVAGYETQYRISLSVGGKCLDNTTTSLSNIGIIDTDLSKSIYLYIPAYTFNPTFEQAYLSSPVKTIKYSDVYQYQVQNIASNAPFNNLVTNGIANIKSVLLLPFYSTTAGGSLTQPARGGQNFNTNTGFIQGVPVWQSPFDPAGCGPTSPLCHITNFNIQVSGQNAIYNLQKYGFEQFNNQLYGQNAVNGGLTDGITSSLISRQNFDLEYCYYYVNVERMLPVEQSVPKSIQILGTNMSAKAVDLIVFVEYGTEIQIDALTGARV